MRVLCKRAYQGWATAEQMLAPGTVYEVPETVAAYLLARPDDFEKADGTPAREVVKLNLPAAVVEQPQWQAPLQDGGGVVTLLERRLQTEADRLAGLKADLQKAREEHGRLAALKATGAFSKTDKAALQKARERVSALDLEIAEAEAGLQALGERLEQARHEAAQERLATLTQEHERLVGEYMAQYAALCKAAVGVVDLAHGVYATGHAIDAVRAQAHKLAASGLPVPAAMLEPTSSRLPIPSSVHIDRYLRAGRSDRREAVRMALGGQP